MKTKKNLYFLSLAYVSCHQFGLFNFSVGVFRFLLFTYEILADAFLLRHCSACNCNFKYSHGRARRRAYTRVCVRVFVRARTVSLNNILVNVLSFFYLKKKQYLSTACIPVILHKSLTKPTVQSYTDAIQSKLSCVFIELKTSVSLDRYLDSRVLSCTNIVITTN